MRVCLHYYTINLNFKKRMNSNIFIISGPSGAGKDSAIEELKKKINIIRPITTTTRPPRPGESEGNPYYFISHQEFQQGIKNGDFFEYAEEDGGNFYGVTKKEIERVKASGQTVIWKVDYKGVITLKKLIPDATAILITAPNETLANRMRKRDKTVTEDFIQRRLEYAKGWEESKSVYDYVVENEENKLAATVEKVFNIIKSKQK